MTEEEALHLLAMVEITRKPGVAEVRQLGNGEHVVILKRRQYHLWSLQDWLALQEGAEKPVLVAAGR